MNSGIRLRTDRCTFEQWIAQTPAAALPAELRGGPAAGADRGRGAVIPPVVAAALAVHGCADLAITVRTWAPAGGSFACLALAGDVAASVRRFGDEREIGLFRLSAVVDEVIRLVPVDPPAGGTGEALENVGLQITVLAADEAVAGWRCTLVGGGSSRWRRVRPGLGRRDWPAMLDVHPQLAADLRFALIAGLGVDVSGGSGSPDQPAESADA